ncbi:MAG: hypothetical protein ACXADO_05250 [Candidatus Thorarchaeota archaeon]
MSNTVQRESSQTDDSALAHDKDLTSNTILLLHGAIVKQYPIPWEEARMTGRRIAVFGANWCSDCRRTKKHLGEQRIHCEWRDIGASTPEGQSAYEPGGIGTLIAGGG